MEMMLGDSPKTRTYAPLPLGWLGHERIHEDMRVLFVYLFGPPKSCWWKAVQIARMARLLKPDGTPDEGVVRTYRKRLVKKGLLIPVDAAGNRVAAKEKKKKGYQVNPGAICDAALTALNEGSGGKFLYCRPEERDRIQQEADGKDTAKKAITDAYLEIFIHDARYAVLTGRPEFGFLMDKKHKSYRSFWREFSARAAKCNGSLDPGAASDMLLRALQRRVEKDVEKKGNLSHLRNPPGYLLDQVAKADLSKVRDELVQKATQWVEGRRRIQAETVLSYFAPGKRVQRSEAVTGASPPEKPREEAHAKAKQDDVDAVAHEEAQIV